MLSPTERRQHILAARAVQVSPVRAHVPAPTQTHSRPAPPSPWTPCAHPIAANPLLSGSYHPPKCISLCLNYSCFPRP